jgi:4-oxalmesaconate hydratase
VYFDTCVYWQPGLQLLLDTIPVTNILYASEMIGAVRGKDPNTGRYFDDTKYLLDQVPSLSPAERTQILGENALRVYPRLAGVLAARQSP